MLCSWGSFSMICHWSCTDWEKLFPSTEYGVMIGRTVVGPVEEGVTGVEEGFGDVVSDDV